MQMSKEKSSPIEAKKSPIIASQASSTFITRSPLSSGANSPSSKSSPNRIYDHEEEVFSDDDDNDDNDSNSDEKPGYNAQSGSKLNFQEDLKQVPYSTASLSKDSSRVHNDRYSESKPSTSPSSNESKDIFDDSDKDNESEEIEEIEEIEEKQSPESDGDDEGDQVPVVAVDENPENPEDSGSDEEVESSYNASSSFDAESNPSSPGFTGSSKSINSVFHSISKSPLAVAESKSSISPPVESSYKSHSARVVEVSGGHAANDSESDINKPGRAIVNRISSVSILLFFILFNFNLWF